MLKYKAGFQIFRFYNIIKVIKSIIIKNELCFYEIIYGKHEMEEFKFYCKDSQK